MTDSILTLAPPPYDLRIRYGDAPEQFADVRFPSRKRGTSSDIGQALTRKSEARVHEERSPAVIAIHGGYWRAKYDLSYLGHFCAALACAGLLTINVEYRRVGDPGGGWPGTFDDIRRAFDHIMQRAEELRINVDDVTVAGHSAGAQLALCLAACERTRIRKVVSLGGVIDLQRAWDLHLSNDAVAEFLGGTPEQVPERYAAASPMGNAIAPGAQSVVHGDKDEDVPLELSRNYVAAKRARNENVEYVEIAGADHFDLIDPRSKFWRADYITQTDRR
jgi:acetyl esterase/lipase